MRKIVCFCLCLSLMLSLLLSQPAWAQSDDPIRFTGVLTQDATIRATRSQAGERLGRLHEGQTVNILSLERDWFVVRDGDVEGFVVAGLFGELEALNPENDPVPSAFMKPNPKTFEPLYNAQASKQVALRATPDAEGKLLATIYPDEALILGELGAEWTVAKKGKNLGYVRADMVKDLEVLHPYQALPPGEKRYPYAATVVAPADITGTLPGKFGALQTLPEGTVVPVSAPDQNGDVLVPYMRTVGQLAGNNLSLQEVVPADAAQPGDLIGVFATFFAPDPDQEITIGRLFNIEKGVALFDGYVLGPGESFSFNDVAAPYSRDNGYELGPIINYVSDKKTGYGGGICQVSTTLYNVLLQLPMKIGRWQTHSSYGIEYAPVEFDAAVGAGNLDLSFDNELPYAVRIAMDVWDGVVTVRMYRDS